MSHIASYKFGESAIVPQGKPYLLSVEGSDKIYSLTHTVDSDGRIHMAVDIADENERLRSAVSLQDGKRRTTSMPPRIFSEDDDAAYDPVTGMIRDGCGIRVKMNAMDAAPNGMKGSGTPDDPYILGSPPSRKRRGVQRDPMDDAAHRPGHRLGDAAGRATVDASYNEMLADLTSAWMSPEQRAQNVSDAQRGTADAPPGGVSASEWSRHQRMLQDAQAWRTPAPTFDAGPEVFAPTQTRAIETMPTGAYIKVGLGANEGDVITWNGAPAKLVRRGDWLFPETIDVGQTRSGRSSGGAPPTRTDSMDAAQAQTIRDQAYNDYVERQQQAWKTPA